MFSGPPLPLPPDFPLRQLVPLINCRQQVGAWLREAGAAHRLLISAAGRCVPVLIGGDLGTLLRCCSQVVVREGSTPRLLETEELIRWRALQVVTGTPYLPSWERLKEIFPGAHLDPAGFQVTLRARASEEVLADCMVYGIPVAGSRIVYDVTLHPPADLVRVAPALARSHPSLSTPLSSS